MVTKLKTTKQTGAIFPSFMTLEGYMDTYYLKDMGNS